MLNGTIKSKCWDHKRELRDMTTALKDPKTDVPGNSETGVISQKTEWRD